MSDSYLNQLDWDGLRLMSVVAHHGSLRRAAAALGISQPTLGRRLRDVEMAVGTTLVVRHARGVTLTDAGHAAVAAAVNMQKVVRSFQRSMSGATGEMRGRVRVACTESVAVGVLLPSLRALRRKHPGVFVDVVVSATASDLDRREADIAIRMFQPKQPNLRARRLGTATTSFYASRAYVEEWGRPTSVSELTKHDAVGPDREPLFVRQAQALGVDVSQLPWRTDAFSVMRALVHQGIAVGALNGPMADDDPNLVLCFGPIAVHPVWLVTHPDLWSSQVVRAVWGQLSADLTPVFSQPVPEQG
jgi:DNA-binding transcriptional LysR family regulator